jgi:hypothetical protein
VTQPVLLSTLIIQTRLNTFFSSYSPKLPQRFPSIRLQAERQQNLRIRKIIVLAGTSALTALAIRTVKVDISHLLRASDSNESSPPASHQATNSAGSAPPTTIAASAPPYAAAQSSGTGGKRSMPARPTETPAKKQSKWSPEEDALIIDLRGSGMKWEDISKRLPGRSAISCRLHYQNYLERRSEWDEERKNKLARLYERYVLSFYVVDVLYIGLP